MNLANLLILFVLLVSNMSPAKAQTVAETPAAEPAQAQTSNDVRKVTASLGVGYSNGMAKFASAGYFINPKWIIEGVYENADTVFFGHSISRSLRSKNFWSPIVYTNLGLLHRKTYGGNQFLDLMTSAFTGKDTHYEVDYWDIGPEFTVGSHWNWGGFHIACDWIGVYWPLYVSKADIKLTEDGIVSRKTRDNLKPDPSARLLRLSFGFSI
jgi:hypothetical protein